MKCGLIEFIVDNAVLAWLDSLGYVLLHGLDVAAGVLAAERSDPNYRDVVLQARLCQTPLRLNAGPHDTVLLS